MDRLESCWQGPKNLHILEITALSLHLRPIIQHPHSALDRCIFVSLNSQHTPNLGMRSFGWHFYSNCAIRHKVLLHWKVNREKIIIYLDLHWNCSKMLLAWKKMSHFIIKYISREVIHVKIFNQDITDLNLWILEHFQYKHSL